MVTLGLIKTILLLIIIAELALIYVRLGQK
jgi:hypothetical protein